MFVGIVRIKFLKPDQRILFLVMFFAKNNLLSNTESNYTILASISSLPGTNKIQKNEMWAGIWLITR